MKQSTHALAAEGCTTEEGDRFCCGVLALLDELRFTFTHGEAVERGPYVPPPIRRDLGYDLEVARLERLAGGVR